MSKKKEIIKKLNDILETPENQTQDYVQQLVAEYNAIGHVPYKEKDKVYQLYHDTLDKIYKELHISVNKRNLDSFMQNLKSVAEKGGDALSGERAKNLGFFNTTSKKGNSLVEEMSRKIQKLKDDMELVRQKIKAIDKAGQEQQ